MNKKKSDSLSKTKDGPPNQINFTGERLVPDIEELTNLYQEHIIRYMFASEFVKSKVVLDAGCGTGYGSHLLSQRGAKKVIGVDVSQEAIDYCKLHYKSENLEYRIDDCTNLHLDPATFDVVVSFEVIEHLKDPDIFLLQIKKALKKDGMFIVSTPNKITYPSGNPFHFHEYTEEEFTNILKKQFNNVSIFYETYPPTLAIYRPGEGNKIQELSVKNHKTTHDESSLYFVAVCSDAKFDNYEGRIFLFDKKTLLLQNYEDLKKWVEILQRDIKVRDNVINDLKKDFEERSKWALDLDKTVAEKDKTIAKLQKDFEERSKRALELDNAILERDKKMAELQAILEAQSKRAFEIQQQLTIKTAQIENLQDTLLTRNTELKELKNSIMFRSLIRIARGLDHYFPTSTRRGEMLRLARVSIAILQMQGFHVFIQAFQEKIKQQVFFKRMRYSFVKKNQNSFHIVNELSMKDNVSEIICNTGCRNHDDMLRKNLAIGYPNILQLQSFPKVSIIIPTYDQVELLEKNIRSIELKTTYKNYEIIVVTNNLNENSPLRSYLRTLKHKVCIFQEPYSFGGINNFAAKQAAGSYLLFLNDDVEIISPNWLEALLHIALDDKVGAVGAKLLFPNGNLQEAGCIVWKNGTAWNYGRNDNPDDPKYNFVREVDYCSGSCLMIKKKVFDIMGGFDLRYFPAYAEDSDMCLSIAKMGYSVLYQPLACVIHHEGQTQGVDVQSGIKSYQIENVNKFREKWQDFLDGRRIDSRENSFLERNRKSGINILYVDHYIPEYDKDAGSLTTYYVLSLLSFLGHKVTFWPDNLIKTEPYSTELQQRGIEIIYGPHNFESFLKERKDNFQICIISRAHVAPKYIDIIKKQSPISKIVYETVDLSFVREIREAELENNPVKYEKAKQTEKNEITLIQKSDITSVKSENEARLLLAKDPSLKLAVIPPIQITKDNSLSYDLRKDLIFLGGFQHPPNIDSVEYLINEIYPKIKKKIPDLNLYVIGSNAPEKVRNLCSKVEGVKFLGYVKNIEQYLEKCRIMVAPLRYGAGVKGKITQSLAYGLPVVTTTIGSEGIVFNDKSILYIADDPQEFAEKTASLYLDKKGWSQMSEAGRKHINSYFSPELLRDTLNQIIRRCVDGGNTK